MIDLVVVPVQLVLQPVFDVVIARQIVEARVATGTLLVVAGWQGSLIAFEGKFPSQVTEDFPMDFPKPLFQIITACLILGQDSPV